MRKINNRLGEKHVTNEGYTIEIVEYFGCYNCTIQFENGFIIKNVKYNLIKEGHTGNPYHKSVFSIGYTGIGKYSNKNNVKIYDTWNSMLVRCYDCKYQEKYPTYIGCLVDDSWHNFQNFARWFEENYKENQQLDKDILTKGNKVYSPTTCTFVPTEINLLFVKSNSSRGKYPIGVSKLHNKFRARLSVNRKEFHLGNFDTPEEAFQAYKTAKEAYIKEVADKWKPLIELRVYEAMYNYRVEITD